MYVVSVMYAGLLLKVPIWDAPQGDLVFDDRSNWELPDFNLPEVKVDKHQANGDSNASTGV